MSVIIKGMEMPKDCVFCPMAHWNKIDRLTGCEVVGGKRYVPETDTDYWESSHRPDWCPLVEVPKHGRLIDADALLRHKGDAYDSRGHLLYAVGMGNIVTAPTIIETEE